MLLEILTYEPQRLEVDGKSEVKLIGVCGGKPCATPLKSTEVILKSSEALAELDFKITEVDLSGVARGDPPQTPIKSIELGDLSSLRVNIALELTLVHQVQLQLNVDEMEGKSIEASQHCREVCGGSLSATSMQSQRVGRQVQRGNSRVGLVLPKS